MSKEIEDKAKAIYDKFHYQICNDCGLSESDSTSFAAKMCSFIHVDGIIEVLNNLIKPEYTQFITKDAVFIDGGLSEEPETMDGYEYMDYLESIKETIKNL